MLKAARVALRTARNYQIHTMQIKMQQDTQVKTQFYGQLEPIKSRAVHNATLVAFNTCLYSNCSNYFNYMNCVLMCSFSNVMFTCYISPGGGLGVVMRVSPLLVLPLLWSLTLSQHTVPYVFFMGQTLANHSYVDISQVGNDVSGSDSVQCHTDLDTCCKGQQGLHRGDWYFPNGNRLLFFIDYGDIYEHRDAQRVDLHRRNSANEPTGIYCCDIPTDAVHDSYNSLRETVYVGLYTSDGG